jgi:V/A-type H+-transporting ATPase subunit G/H
VSIEAIKAVREMEDESEQLKKNAIQKAKQMLAEANSSAAKRIDEATKSAELEASVIIADAQKEGDSKYAKIIEATNQECVAMKTAVSKNIPKAVEIILGRIVKPDGNS